MCAFAYICSDLHYVYVLVFVYVFVFVFVFVYVCFFQKHVKKKFDIFLKKVLTLSTTSYIVVYVRAVKLWFVV